MTVEIPIKQWRVEEAERLGVTVNVINDRLYRRRLYPHLKIRRVNPRVLFVIVEKNDQAHARR